VASVSLRVLTNGKQHIERHMMMDEYNQNTLESNQNKIKMYILINLMLFEKERMAYKSSSGSSSSSSNNNEQPKK